MIYYRNGGYSNNNSRYPYKKKRTTRRRSATNISNPAYSNIQSTNYRFNGNVPRISRKPVLSDYGLPENIKDILDQNRRAVDESRQKINDCPFYIHAIIFFISLLAIAKMYSGENEFSLLFCIPAFAPALGIAFFGGLFIISPLYTTIMEKMYVQVKEDDRRKIYDQYLSDLDAYNYWQTKKSIDYWIRLDGHQFEQEVAQVFRAMGYKAEVSKSGGDGGIDIVLSGKGEAIAVQCKHHKSAVAPAVARDLYGTMSHFGYRKGMIVSTNGYTSGVYEFVKDKPIELLTLQDIMRMQESGQ